LFQLFKQFGNAGAEGRGQILRHGGVIDILGGFEDFREVGFDNGFGKTGGEHHQGEDIGVEHAVERDAVGCGVGAGDDFYGFDERMAVFGACFADERAVDIEENQ